MIIKQTCLLMKDLIPSLHSLFLGTDINYLCTTLHKPGGTIKDPVDANRTISNPGSTVRHTTEIRLKFTCRSAKYFVNAGRTPKGVTLACSFVRQFRVIDDIIEKYQPPQELEPVSTSLPIVKWVEYFGEYLRGVLGVDNIPLTYIVRQEKKVSALVDDPIVT